MTPLTPQPSPLADHSAVQLVAPDGAHATILLYGAHVLSWCPRGAGEQLYLSPRALAGAGQAVRGGVPVIFPQFDRRGPEPGVPRHGFARTQSFVRKSQRIGTESAEVTLALTDNAATRALWPRRFELELSVTVGGPKLELALTVHNTGDVPWSYTAALHTYLSVSDIAEVSVRGLEGRRYWDNVEARDALDERAEARIDGEVDRIYADVSELVVEDSARALSVRSTELPDAVIWNPGPEKCARLSDMPEDGYRYMLCVEAGRILEPRTLAPGERSGGRQILTVRA